MIGGTGPHPGLIEYVAVIKIVDIPKTASTGGFEKGANLVVEQCCGYRPRSIYFPRERFVLGNNTAIIEPCSPPSCGFEIKRSNAIANKGRGECAGKDLRWVQWVYCQAWLGVLAPFTAVEERDSVENTSFSHST